MTPVSIALPALPNARPDGFVEHAFEREFVVDAPRARVWTWLEDPETFTGRQIWPFRVEFLEPRPDVEPGFEVGGINIHHGPFLNFAGMLTEIREGEYRDLQYFYGSFLFGLRLIRPTRLEFWVEDVEQERTRVRLRVGSYVRKPLAGIWTFGQRLFWARFARWMTRSVTAPSRALAGA